MAISNFTTRADLDLAHGWVLQPDGRGTFDILYGCLITTFLCSWSALFLHIPAHCERPLAFVAHKLRWLVFALAFPEMITGMAAEQWRSACQSVEDFSRLGKRWESVSHFYQPSEFLSQVRENLLRQQNAPWTMRHAFFADMGGFWLDCPDCRPFPVDAHQLFYMVENYHLQYPDVQERTIEDRNKADGFARAITLAQIVWFLVQSLGRWMQSLDLSTIELSTLAFIFCTLNTFYFWRHKPLDVVTPIVLSCSVPIEEIVAKAGKGSLNSYSQTPLDFVKPPVSRSSLCAPFWFGIKIVVDWRQRDESLPIRSFENSRTTPPRGITTGDLLFAIVFSFSYFGIHLAGWNFIFPSRTEQTLWRISSLALLGLLVFYLAAVVFGTVAAGWIARTFFDNDKETTILGVGSLLSRRTAILFHAPVVAAYALARAYIIVEGFVSLRTLSFTAFASVDWSKFVGGS
jgi:hypothetical protein